MRDLISVEYMKFSALRWCFTSGSRSSLPSCTATASSLSIRHVFLMISHKVYEVTMELRHLYPLLGKSHETLRLSLPSLEGELQRENKLISYERAFKMLENDMYIAGIGQAVLELLSFKVESGNHQRGISLLQKFSDIFGNMKFVSLKMTSHLTSHNFQILKIEIFSKLCKIWTCNLKKWWKSQVTLMLRNYIIISVAMTT